MADECTCDRAKTGCLIHPQGGGARGASRVRKEIEEKMRRLVAPQGAEEPWRTIERLTRLINEGTITKEQARQIYREEHDEEPVDATPPTDTDTPPELFRLLEGLIAHHQANLTRELSRSAMKLRLQGQLEALEWVMQQIEDIRDSTEITNEPEHEGMPHEHGLVPPQEGDTVMVNGKLYVRRGFAWEEVQFSGVLTADMMQQPGESRADWKNRTFAMQYGSGRLSQRDPSQQSLPPHSLGPILLTPKVARSMKEEAERQWAREQARMDETNFGPRNAADTIHDTLRDWWASPQYQAGKSPVTKIKITDITES